MTVTRITHRQGSVDSERFYRRQPADDRGAEHRAGNLDDEQDYFRLITGYRYVDSMVFIKVNKDQAGRSARYRQAAGFDCAGV